MASGSKMEIELVEGSSIAVIGGGPAGSFFTYYALDFASRLDLNIEIDVYEAKNFTKIGSGGCNHCGGIISESLVIYILIYESIEVIIIYNITGGYAGKGCSA